MASSDYLCSVSESGPYVRDARSLISWRQTSLWIASSLLAALAAVLGALFAAEAVTPAVITVWALSAATLLVSISQIALDTVHGRRREIVLGLISSSTPRASLDRWNNQLGLRGLVEVSLVTPQEVESRIFAMPATPREGLYSVAVFSVRLGQFFDTPTVTLVAETKLHGARRGKKLLQLSFEPELGDVKHSGIWEYYERERFEAELWDLKITRTRSGRADAPTEILLMTPGIAERRDEMIRFAQDPETVPVTWYYEWPPAKFLHESDVDENGQTSARLNIIPMDDEEWANEKDQYEDRSPWLPSLFSILSEVKVSISGMTAVRRSVNKMLIRHEFAVLGNLTHSGTYVYKYLHYSARVRMLLGDRAA